MLKDIGRVNYSWATDEEAMSAFRDLSQSEGIIPAIESSHAVAGAYKAAADLKAKGYNKAVMIVNISGRGDKDMATAGKWFGYLTDDQPPRSMWPAPTATPSPDKKRRLLIMTNEATTPSGQPLGISHKPSKSGAMFTKFKAENKPAFIGYLPMASPTQTSRLTPSNDGRARRRRRGNRPAVLRPGHGRPGHPGCRLHRPEQRRDHQARVRGRRNRGQRRRRAAHHELLEPRVPLRRRALRPRLRERRRRRSHHPGPYPGRGGGVDRSSDRHGLDRIFLVSPDSSTERLETVARNARGFVYAAARMGVTGERATIDASPELLVEHTRQAGAENVCVGIGVSTAEQGAKVGSYADGVIVGSALVHTLLADDNKTARDPKEGLKLLAAKSEELAEGIHNAR